MAEVVANGFTPSFLIGWIGASPCPVASLSASCAFGAGDEGVLSHLDWTSGVESSGKRGRAILYRKLSLSSAFALSRRLPRRYRKLNETFQIPKLLGVVFCCFDLFVIVFVFLAVALCFFVRFDRRHSMGFCEESGAEESGAEICEESGTGFWEESGAKVGEESDTGLKCHSWIKIPILD